MAIVNGPSIVDLPIKHGDFPVRHVSVCQRVPTCLGARHGMLSLPRLCGARRDAHQRELFLSDSGDDVEHREGFPAALDQLLHRWYSVWAGERSSSDGEQTD